MSIETYCPSHFAFQQAEAAQMAVSTHRVAVSTTPKGKMTDSTHRLTDSAYPYLPPLSQFFYTNTR